MATTINSAISNLAKAVVQKIKIAMKGIAYVGKL